MTSSSIKISPAASNVSHEPTPGSHAKFSLIISTRNRMKELDNFLVNLDRQSFRNFEILVVDQNSTEGVSDLLGRHCFQQQYFHSEKRGAARGRNVALRVAQGDILAIPDDDCWYPPDLLEQVISWFEAHRDIDMLCVLECDPEGKPMVPYKPPTAGFCTDQPIGFRMERSVWMAQSSMVFMRREVRDTIGILDESIGVGADTKYQSGEETDYFLRAMHAGFKMWFEPSLRVFHVELRTPERLRKTNYPYSVGTGHVLRMRRCKPSRVLAVVCRSFGGAMLSACQVKFRQTALYLRRSIGILVGYSGL